MNVLLIGGGGREHALAWSLAQSPGVARLYAAPGNPGIAKHAELVELAASDHAAVVAFCNDHAIGLVVIGPEGPLVAGLADDLRAAGIAAFGPGKAAARLEGSKGFTKDLCAKAGIPTARYVRVEGRDAALAALEDFDLPVVVKADGLAAGKGVVVAETRAEAEAAIDDGPYVIEEFMGGVEASLFAITDGVTIAPFGSAEDHKRVGEGDTGPNTGGMGAFSPSVALTPELEARAMAEIVEPTVRALEQMGTPYSGVLYAGLMLTGQGPKLVEYNCRFGDPEAQVLLPRFEGDLLQLMLACAERRLREVEPPSFSREAALTVVLAAKGYPGTPETGGRIGGIEDAEAAGALVFQAGTRAEGDAVVASGGRVLTVTATGPTLKWARAASYTAVDRIQFPSGFHRRDIGVRALDTLADSNAV